MTVDNDLHATRISCDADGCAEVAAIPHTVGEWPEKVAELQRKGWRQTRLLAWLCPKHKGAG